MRERKNLAIVLLMTNLIAFTLPATTGLAEDPKARPEVGDVAPDFTLPDVHGKTRRLSDLRGKVVFLNFWATWCPSCREEMPTMEALYQEFKNEGLEILAVSIDQGSDAMVKRVVSAFRHEFGPMTFPLLLDSKQEVMDRYRVTFIPTHFYVDRKGYIRDKYVGPKDRRKPETWKLLEGLLNER